MTKPTIIAANNSDSLVQLIDTKRACIGVIGLGYVGLPLAITCANSGFQTIGLDIDETKISTLNSGTSYINAVASSDLKTCVHEGSFIADADFTRISDCDIVVICVPTPLGKDRQPDLSYVVDTTKQIANYLRPAHLIILESTTYPGTTKEILLPILEANGMISGLDFFAGYSPEREDPGNASFQTASIPKVVAGDGELATMLVEKFYQQIIDKVIVVSTLGVAEAVKITENVFRAVNIAMVNELKSVYDKMGIDIWEVIDAAATKPFGYMPFYPGPGLGGHCIPIDPFYLSWKARQHGIDTRFIELAGEINTAMPTQVIDRLAKELKLRSQKNLENAKILIIGMAYKKNVPDIRESPSLALMELLDNIGACCDYHDNLVPEIPMTREYANFAGRQSVQLTETGIAGFDAVLISTDHDKIDYELLANKAKLIIDTRNAIDARNLSMENTVKA